MALSMILGGIFNRVFNALSMDVGGCFNWVFNAISMDVCGCFQKGFQGIINECRELFPNDSTGNSQRV